MGVSAWLIVDHRKQRRHIRRNIHRVGRRKGVRKRKTDRILTARRFHCELFRVSRYRFKRCVDRHTGYNGLARLLLPFTVAADD